MNPDEYKWTVEIEDILEKLRVNCVNLSIEKCPCLPFFVNRLMKFKKEALLLSISWRVRCLINYHPLKKVACLIYLKGSQKSSPLMVEQFGLC